VRETHVIPAQVLAEAGTTDPMELANLGIEAARDESWKTALVLLAEAYRLFSAEPELKEGAIEVSDDEEEPVARRRARARMFSHYGLALAMASHAKAEEGARFCEIAIRMESWEAEHYVLLARIWQRARNRLKTVQTIDRGLKETPTDHALHEFRREIGWREKSPVTFLPRSHPVNVTLGKILRRTGERAKGQPKAPRAKSKG
jgi:hypothetical protein